MEIFIYEGNKLNTINKIMIYGFELKLLLLF